jgi:hypothetical protein
MNKHKRKRKGLSRLYNPDTGQHWAEDPTKTTGVNLGAHEGVSGSCFL